MYCKKCDNYIAGGLEKCPHCGWVVGSVVTFDATEKKHDDTKEKEEKLVFKKRLILELFVMLTIILVVVGFALLKYSLKDDNSLSAIIYSVNGKESNIFSFINVRKDLAKQSETQGVASVLTFKYVMFIVGLAFGVLGLVYGYLNIKKKENKSVLGFLLVEYAFINSSLVSTDDLVRYLNIGISVVILILVFFDLKMKFNDKPKYKIIGSVISSLFLLVCFNLLTLDILKISDKKCNINDYLYLSSVVNATHSSKSYGSFLVIITMLLMVIIAITIARMIATSTKKKYTFVISFAAFICYFIVLIFSYLNEKKHSNIDLAINYIYVVPILALGFIASLIAIWVNRKENVRLIEDILMI